MMMMMKETDSIFTIFDPKINEEGSRAKIEIVAIPRAGGRGRRQRFRCSASRRRGGDVMCGLLLVTQKRSQMARSPPRANLRSLLCSLRWAGELG